MVQVVSVVGIPPGEETVRVVTETVSPGLGWITRVTVCETGGDGVGVGAPVAVGAVVVGAVLVGAVVVGAVVVGALVAEALVVVLVGVVRWVVRVWEPNGGEAASCGPLVSTARSSDPDGLALAVDEVRTTTAAELAACREPLDEHAVSAAAAATPAAATATHTGTSLMSGQPPPGDVLPIGCATSD